mgnify:CR=1 FL=1
MGPCQGRTCQYSVAKVVSEHLKCNIEDLGYLTGNDLAQGTGFQDLGRNVGNDNDQSCSGYLHLFNPSSTTFVKHFIARLNNAQDISSTHYSAETLIAGYFNDTDDITAIQFKFSSGNIDAGTIQLIGIT